MVKFKRNSLLLAKNESTYGTDPTPSASTNALEISDVSWNDNFEPIERNLLISSLSPKPSLKGKQFTEVTFQMELHGSGAAGTAPRIGALFQACGFEEAVSAGSSVVYTPTTTGGSSITLYVYEDGILRKLTGGYGNFKVTAGAGALAIIDFTFQGIYNAPSDSSNPSPTYDGVDPVPVKSANLTYNSISSIVVNQFELDMQNTIVQRPNVNASTGLEGFTITGRRGQVVLDPEMVSLATLNWRSDILNTTRAASIQIGSSAGNKTTITIPEMMVTNVSPQDRDGILVDQITGEASSSSGDDEVEIKFE